MVFTPGDLFCLEVVFSTGETPDASLDVVIAGTDRQTLALGSPQGFYGASF